MEQFELRRLGSEREEEIKLYRSAAKSFSSFAPSEQIGQQSANAANDDSSFRRLAEQAESLGWKAAVQRLSEELGPDEAVAFRNRFFHQNAAWILGLLDPRKRRKVLVFEQELGNLAVVLSRFFERVYVLAATEAAGECQRKRIEWLGIRNVEFLESRFPIALENDSCDAAAIQLTGRSELNDAVLREIRRVLGTSGSYCIGFQNRNDLRYLRTSLEGFKRPYSPRGLAHKLRSHFSHIQFHPLQFSLHVLREILSPYPRNSMWETRSASLTNTLKNYLRPNFAPAYGAVSSNSGQKTTLAALILDETAVRLATGPLTVRHLFIVKPNGLLMIAGRAAGPDQLIIRISLDELTQRRQVNNHETLRDLSGVKCLNRKVPEPLLSGVAEGFPFFVETCIPGTIFSNPTEECFLQSAEVLSAFHRETARATIIDDPLLDELVFSQFELAVAWIEEEARGDFHEIKNIIGGALRGQSIPLVRSHGDFTVDNVLFDGSEAAGIIDWDYSRARAFPLMDLIYFLDHELLVREDRSFEEVITRRLSGQYTNLEQQIIRRYCRALEISESWVPLFTILSWVYHLAFRLQHGECYHMPFMMRWCRADVSGILRFLDEFRRCRLGADCKP